MGPTHNFLDGSVTQVIYSRDGTKYALHSIENGVVVYDFDRSNGELTFLQQIRLGEARGAMFSPNDRFLYANTRSELYQIDMWEEDLEDGLVRIDTFDGFTGNFGIEVLFGAMTHGPDCKIYMHTLAGISWMHTIEFPDEKGIACGFQQHSIYLDVPLPPYFSNVIPFYRMDEDEPCDPTLVGLADIYGVMDSKVSVFPNPVSTIATLRIDDGYDMDRYELLSIDGRVVSGASIDDTMVSIDMGALPSGMYYLRVYDRDGRYEVERLVKGR